MSRLLRFWRDYLWRYRFWYGLGVVCLVATNALTVAIPSFVQRAIDSLGEGQGTDHTMVWVWAIGLGGLAIMVVRTLSRVLFFNPGRAAEFRIKNALFEHLLSLPQTFYDRMNPGEILSRGTNDINSVRALAGFATLQLFNVILLLLFTVGRMVAMNAWLTLWCLLPLVFSALFLRWAIRKMFLLVNRAQAQIAVLSARVLESYNGVSVVHAYGAIKGVTARFDDANDELLEIALSLSWIRSWMLPVVQVTGSLCVVLLLKVGGAQVVAGELTIGELTAFTVYISVVVTGLNSMGWLINSAQRGWVALGRVYEVLDEVDGRPVARLQGIRSGEGAACLEVRDLTFAYPSGAGADPAPPALQAVSLRIESGEVVGIYGPTGAGKTTLLNLLARVYDPPPGTVWVDGVDVLDLPVTHHWRRLGYVGQTPHLFSRSLAENVLLGQTWSPEDPDQRRALDSALELAALTPDLENLPQGIRTVVGERGITLSGGQRQRVALARTLPRDCQILLLDDVLSAVDHDTEKRLIQSIYERLGPPGQRHASALIVSHRISLLAAADRILVFEDGRLVDQGPHDELLTRQDQPYAQAWRLQRAAEALARGGEGS